MNYYKFAVILQENRNAGDLDSSARMVPKDMVGKSSEEAVAAIKEHFAKESPNETVVELRELSCTPMVLLASVKYGEAGYR